MFDEILADGRRMGSQFTADHSRAITVYGGLHAQFTQPRGGLLDDLQVLLNP
jgi:hypothetical protein